MIYQNSSNIHRNLCFCAPDIGIKNHHQKVKLILKISEIGEPSIYQFSNVENNPDILIHL